MKQRPISHPELNHKLKMTSVSNIPVEINLGLNMCFDMTRKLVKKNRILLTVQLQLVAPRQMTSQSYF